MSALPETVGVTEAAAILRMSEDALMRKARVGRIPGARIGRQWVFVRADLVELIRERARERTGRRPIDIRALRIANPVEKSASRLEQEIERELAASRPTKRRAAAAEQLAPAGD